MVNIRSEFEAFLKMLGVLSITHGLANDNTKYSIRIGVSEDISESDLNKILDFKNAIQPDTDRYIIDIFAENTHIDCGGLSKMVYMYDSSMLFNPPNQE